MQFNGIDIKKLGWPFQLAEALIKRVKRTGQKEVIFETGYGPSGLPHIGTFGEVFRTTLVRQAFEALAEAEGVVCKTRLIAFSDDMDGLRKVPENIPNSHLLEENLGKPLTSVPDPFGTHPSFGEHNNARLQKFLDEFGFDYEFMTATQCYKSGVFDEKLKLAVKKYDKIMKLMLPTLGEERQATYSPFLPICPETGEVLYCPMEELHPDEGEVSFRTSSGELHRVSVGGGNVKMQWKPDMGMRWAALGIDFEMYGKDHLASAKLYSGICKILDETQPEQYFYELFLDDKGGKISKSKGNGLSLEEWLTYGTRESLALFMFNNPKKAKRLYFDSIPKASDEYISHFNAYAKQEEEQRLKNPVYYLHNGEVGQGNIPISFSMLLNLASACNPENKDILWGFIKKYDGATNEKATPQSQPMLDEMAGKAVKYYEDFIKPNKQFRQPDERELKALTLTKTKLKEGSEESAEELQQMVYDIARECEFENAKELFKAIYEVLLGQAQGPRIGSFIALFGKDKMVQLIEEKTC